MEWKKLEDMNLEEMKKYCQELESKTKNSWAKMKPGEGDQKPEPKPLEGDPEMEKKIEIELAEAKKLLAEKKPNSLKPTKAEACRKKPQSSQSSWLKAKPAKRSAKTFIAGDMSAFVEKSSSFQTCRAKAANKPAPETAEKDAEEEVMEKAKTLSESKNPYEGRDFRSSEVNPKLAEKING